VVDDLTLLQYQLLVVVLSLSPVVNGDSADVVGSLRPWAAAP